MEGRSYEGDTNLRYRFGFNGKEEDDETYTQDYGFRQYNSDLGRFLSVDPLTKEYPWYAPYQFAGNKPINSIDIDGLEPYDINSPSRGVGYSFLRAGTSSLIISANLKLSFLPEKYKEILKNKLKGDGKFVFDVLGGIPFFGLSNLDNKFLKYLSIGIGTIQGIFISRAYITKMEKVVKSEYFKKNEKIISDYDDLTKQKENLESNVRRSKDEVEFFGEESELGKNAEKELKQNQKNLSNVNTELENKKDDYEKAKNQNLIAIKNSLKVFKSFRSILKELQKR